MSAIRSAVALRTILVDTLLEMLAINSTILPDGATAYENQSRTLWRLDKDAGTVFDALIGSGVVLKPDDNTDARWFAEERNGVSPYFFSSYLADVTTVTLVNVEGGEWAYLGNVSGTYDVNTGDTTVFTLDTATGEVTYNGPVREFLVTMQASISDADGAGPVHIDVCVSRNNDVVAGITINYPEKGQMEQSVTGAVSLVTVQRLVQLNPGQTVRMAFKNATNGDDIAVPYYQSTIVPV